jgi:hypothetical protein
MALVATVYKDVGRVADIPEAPSLMVDYNPDTELGTSCFIGQRRVTPSARPSNTRWIRRRGINRRTASAPTSRTSPVLGRLESTPRTPRPEPANNRSGHINRSDRAVRRSRSAFSWLACRSRSTRREQRRAYSPARRRFYDRSLHVG